MRHAANEARIRDSAWLFIKGICQRWWLLVVGVALSSVDVFERVSGKVIDIPSGVFYIGAGLAFFAATFLTYHDARKEIGALRAGSGKTLVERLDEFAHEADILAAEFRADAGKEPLPGFAPDHRLRVLAQQAMDDLTERVTRELRLYAPQHMDYWRTHPPHVPIPPATFEDWAQLAEFAGTQLRHIIRELRREAPSR